MKWIGTDLNCHRQTNEKWRKYQSKFQMSWRNSTNCAKTFVSSACVDAQHPIEFNLREYSTSSQKRWRVPLSALDRLQNANRFMPFVVQTNSREFMLFARDRCNREREYTHAFEFMVDRFSATQTSYYHRSYDGIDKEIAKKKNKENY